MTMHSRHDHSHHHDTLSGDKRILWIALTLNFSMFIVEVWQGFRVDSTALIADSMDFLSDSFSYVITMYVLTKAVRVRAKASIIKALLMLVLAAGALMQGAYNVLHGNVPSAYTMSWVALLALAANLTTAALLYKTRNRDSNMNSIWLCSRNDAIANILILIAAWLVYVTHTLWPDLLVALAIAGLEGSSALQIIKQAKEELKH